MNYANLINFCCQRRHINYVAIVLTAVAVLNMHKEKKRIDFGFGNCCILNILIVF